MYGISPPGLILLSPALMEQWSGYLSAVLVVLLIYQQWRLHQLRRRPFLRRTRSRLAKRGASFLLVILKVHDG